MARASQERCCVWRWHNKLLLLLLLVSLLC
jgi:hypothetical protein